MKKLEEHQRVGDGHKQRAEAAAAELAALRAQHEERRRGLEPHTR